MTIKEETNTKEPFQCGHCGNTTLMIVVAEGLYALDHSDLEDYYICKTHHDIKTLLCPCCNKFNVYDCSETISSHVYLGDEPEEHDYDKKCLYPASKVFADSSEQAIHIQEAYRDAAFCFKLRLFTPCVIMCRKTLEMLCTYFLGEESIQLYRALDKMKKRGIIDNKLYEWANILRSLGNEAVHTITRFSKNDAQDVLDFTYAIIEYCIDFDFKFERLLERRGKKVSIKCTSEPLSEEQVKILTKALENDELSIRYYAAVTLIRNNRELSQAISTFFSFIEKKVRGYSDAAKKFLKTAGASAVSEIISTLEKSQDHSVREAAVIVLGEIGSDEIGESSPEVINALITALTDSNECVRLRAALALEKAGFDAVNIFLNTYSLTGN